MKLLWIPSDQECDKSWAAMLCGKRVVVKLFDGRQIPGKFQRLSPLGLHIELESGNITTLPLFQTKYVEVQR